MPTEEEIRAARAQFDTDKQEALNALKDVERARAAFEASIDPSLDLLMQERDSAKAAAERAAAAQASLESQIATQDAAFQNERASLLAQLAVADEAKVAAEERTVVVEAELAAAQAEIRSLRDQLSGA